MPTRLTALMLLLFCMCSIFCNWKRIIEIPSISCSCKAQIPCLWTFFRKLFEFTKVSIIFQSDLLVETFCMLRHFHPQHNVFFSLRFPLTTPWVSWCEKQFGPSVCVLFYTRANPSDVSSAVSSHFSLRCKIWWTKF